MPLETVRAFQDHGEVKAGSLTQGVDEAKAAARRPGRGRRRLRRRRRDAGGRGRAEVRRLLRRAAGRDPGEGRHAAAGVTAAANPLLGGPAAAAAPGAVRRRHLRRLRRPDEAEADPRPLRARLPQAAAGAVRDRRRRPLAAELGAVRRRDEEGGQGARARPVPAGRLGLARGRDALRRHRVLGRRGRGSPRHACSRRSTRSAARAATASTTSPSRRRRSRTR